MRFRSTFSLVLAAVVGSETQVSAQQALPDPNPEPAASAIIAAFAKHSIVAMPMGHGYKDLSDFVLALIRHPLLPEVVNDIVIECTNSRYQAALTRYVLGEDVPLDEAREAWQNTQPGCADYHDQFFALVRRVNERLPAAKRMRVLAGEPTRDWNTMTPGDINYFLGSGARDSNMARVVEQEVLAKGRKALVLYGTGHLYRTMKESGVALYEQRHPGVTLVIEAITGCAGNEEIERRMARWPVPSLAIIRGTSLVEMDDVFPRVFGRWSQSADAVLYLGPTALLLRQPMPAHIWMDSAYISDLRKRYATGGASLRAKALIDSSAILNTGRNPLLCNR